MTGARPRPDATRHRLLKARERFSRPQISFWVLDTGPVAAEQQNESTRSCGRLWRYGFLLLQSIVVERRKTFTSGQGFVAERLSHHRLSDRV